MEGECKTCGDGESMNAAIKPHPMGEVVPNTGGEVYARPWTPAEEAAADARLSPKMANQAQASFPPIEPSPPRVEYLAGYRGPPWFETPKAGHARFSHYSDPPMTQRQAAPQSLSNTTGDSTVEYLRQLRIAPWFEPQPQWVTDETPKRDKSDEDEATNPKGVPPKEGEKPETEPVKGDKVHVDDPDGEAGTGNNNYTSKDFDGPEDDTIDDERAKHAKGEYQNPKPGVELMCDKALRIWLHIQWFAFKLIAKVHSEDEQDAKDTAKAAAKAENLRLLGLANPGSADVATAIVGYLQNTLNWKCENPCKMTSHPAHVRYGLLRAYFIERDTANGKVFYRVWVRYRHKVEGVVDVKCEK